MSAPLPFALVEQARAISWIGKTVTIEYDQSDEAERLYDWLREQVPA